MTTKAMLSVADRREVKSFPYLPAALRRAGQSTRVDGFAQGPGHGHPTSTGHSASQVPLGNQGIRPQNHRHREVTTRPGADALSRRKDFVESWVLLNCAPQVAHQSDAVTRSFLREGRPGLRNRL